MLGKPVEITFETLSQVCPELLNIRAEAKRTLAGETDVSEYWEKYEILKARMKRQIGLTAQEGLPSFIYTTTAYNCAHKAIFGDTR